MLTLISCDKRWVKFLLGGLVNTGFSYTVYLLLKVVLTYQVAYLLSYVSGVVFSYLVNSLVVFRVTLSWRRFLSFPLVYVGQYLAGALLLSLLVEILGISKVWAPLLVAAALLPLTYLLSKLLLLRKKKADG